MVAYFDGLDGSYIEVPNHADLSLLTNGTKKHTILMKIKPVDMSYTVYHRLTEKGTSSLKYEWDVSYKILSNGLVHFAHYETNPEGAYGIGSAFDHAVATPNEILWFGGTINEASTRLVKTYLNGTAYDPTDLSGIPGVNVISGGSGYTSAPTIALSGGGGTGAKAAAYITNGLVSSISMASRGTGYTSPPAVSISGGGGSGATGETYIIYPSHGNSPVYIGGNATKPGRFYKGYIYNYMLFNEELSESDMKLLIDGTKKPTDFTSLRLWHDYTTGTAKDLSGRGHDGIVFGNVTLTKESDLPSTGNGGGVLNKYPVNIISEPTGAQVTTN